VRAYPNAIAIVDLLEEANQKPSTSAYMCLQYIGVRDRWASVDVPRRHAHWYEKAAVEILLEISQRMRAGIRIDKLNRAN
jgi:hypothetical protein